MPIAVLLSFIGAVTTRLEPATAILLPPQPQTTPADIGVECAVRIGKDDDPQWVDLAVRYRRIGATHL